MRQIIQDIGTGELRIEELPAPVARPGGIVVATRASVVSAGTEKHAIALARASTLDKMRARPEAVRQVMDRVRTDGLVATWQTVRSRLSDWIPLGYSSSGVVVAIGEGVTGFKPGDRVACAGQGFASHAELVWVPANFVVLLPESVSFEDGAFATLGAIALHGIHTAKVGPGDRVAVIGLGLLGQLVVQMLTAYGNPVLGLDVRPESLALATKLGATAVAHSGADEAEAASKMLTQGTGVDAVIITAATPSSEPLAVATRIARRNGRICVVGLVGMDADRQSFYEKELQLVVAKSYGPGRDDPVYQRLADYPQHLARWTVARNMSEFLRLVKDGRVTSAPLVGARADVARAPEEYEKLLIGQISGSILISYSEQAEVSKRVVEFASPPASSARGVPVVGFIGAGGFARSVLLPALEEAGALERRIIVAGSLHAGQAARRFGFRRASSEASEAFRDNQVNVVVIATRHDSHARLTTEALEAGKNVFVEKPLALNVKDLQMVAVAARRGPGRLQVGFNRRFAPAMHKVRQHMSEGGSGPLLMTYRVNAGVIPVGHWTRDPVVGGGRILGEVCHFVDALQCVAQAPPVRVFASGGAPDLDAQDHLAVSIDFDGGSRGIILYSGTGPASLPKERLEVMGRGRYAVLDNYRSVELGMGRRRWRVRSFGQDKGHAAELQAFLHSVREGKAQPIPLNEMLLSTLATLSIERSLSENGPVQVDLSQLGDSA